MTTCRVTASTWRASALGWVLVVLLMGCQTTRPDAVTGATASPTSVSTSAPVAQADRYAPGTFHFILSPSGSGNYYGWQIQMLAAEGSAGFRPFLSAPMQAGQSLRAELWPGRYRVRVLLLDGVERDEWIEIVSGRPTVVFVDIGFLANGIDVVSGDEAQRLVAASYPFHDLPVATRFDPLTIALRPGWFGRYHGPQRDGAPVGQGRLDILEGDREVAVIETATVEAGRFVGMPSFTDGRRVDGPMAPDYTLPDGAITTWPDGRRFQGRYDGLSPQEGHLTYPDGTVWEGWMEQDEPAGNGQMSLTDGTTISGVSGIDVNRFDGAYACSTPQGVATTCYYFEGQRIATAEAYEGMVTARDSALAAADEPVVEPATAPIDGCTPVEGEFTADGGLSRLTFDGAGQGHMWQRTYVGTELYTFDIDFKYDGTRAGMRFDYGPGIYRDAAGQEVERKTIPSGDSDCAYDGSVLIINGKPFTR